MKDVVRSAMLIVAVTALVAIGAVAQSNDQSPSASTQGSATAKHARNQASSESGTSKLNAIDRHFIRKAGEGGLAEVELGKLATEKAHSEDVKKFGQRMVDDHSKANDQLKQLAESKGVSLPTQLDAKDKATMDRLGKLKGEQFDRAYMNDMVQDHAKDVSEFKKESTTAKDPEIKSFASQTLPTLEDHLKEARGIAPKERKQAKAEKKGGL
ncbi:MAG: DUF4142 domain-containing protein [Acidobacteria bacterium]|nr:DUF4142 domain-containing protein [Acidobacteriota bacterium]